MSGSLDPKDNKESWNNITDNFPRGFDTSLLQCRNICIQIYFSIQRTEYAIWRLSLQNIVVGVKEEWGKRSIIELLCILRHPLAADYAESMLALKHKDGWFIGKDMERCEGRD